MEKPKLLDNAVANPLLEKWPRKYPCCCMSGKPFRRCCLPKMPAHVSVAQALKLEALIDKHINRGRVANPVYKDMRHMEGKL